MIFQDTHKPLTMWFRGWARSDVPDARESPGGANRWLVVESGPV